MHVYCDLFDVLDFAERNENLSTVEAPTSPFCQRQVAHENSYIFDYAFSVFISICMFSTTSMLCKTLE